MPCPNGVDIPRIFQLYNDGAMYNDMTTSKNRYMAGPPMGFTDEQRGDQCIECGECLEACPQSIDVPEQLKETHAALTA